MIAAIRIRGRVGVPRDIRDTLYLLKLRRKFVCRLFDEKKEIIGMLNKVKHYIAYGKINEEALRKLIEERGRKIGDKRLNADEVNKIVNYLKSGKSFNEVCKDLKVKDFFRLKPPKGGFKKSIKLLWPQGICGNIENKINDLILAMV